MVYKKLFLRKFYTIIIFSLLSSSNLFPVKNFENISDTQNIETKKKNIIITATLLTIASSLGALWAGRHLIKSDKDVEITENNKLIEQEKEKLLDLTKKIAEKEKDLSAKQQKKDTLDQETNEKQKLYPQRILENSKLTQTYLALSKIIDAERQNSSLKDSIDQTKEDLSRLKKWILQNQEKTQECSEKKQALTQTLPTKECWQEFDSTLEKEIEEIAQKHNTAEETSKLQTLHRIISSKRPQGLFMSDIVLPQMKQLAEELNSTNHEIAEMVNEYLEYVTQ